MGFSKKKYSLSAMESQDLHSCGLDATYLSKRLRITPWRKDWSRV